MNKYIREPGNFYTHLLPALLAVPGLWLLLSKADTNFEIFAALIYGLGMLLLFSISSIYHSVPRTEKAIRFWQKFDHCSIYIMIAGSFTPTCIVAFNNQMGWTMFVVIWLIALIGIFLKVFNRLKNKMISTGLYILMGCMVLPFLGQLSDYVSWIALTWLILGGVFYIGGTYFYSKDKPLFKYLHSHELWHLFVNLGAVAHFVYNYAYIFA